MTNEIGLGIIEKEGKFLLINEENSQGDLLWRFPGGRRKNSDITLDETLLRETWNKTGINVSPIRIYDKWPRGEDTLFYLVAPYVSGGLILDKNKIEDIGWYNPKDVSKLLGRRDFFPAESYLNTFQRP
jgi:8-oxo-dGTP pyrophosphatase MutT (NUDIX family)